MNGTAPYLPQICALNGGKNKKGIMHTGFENSVIMSLYEMQTHLLKL